MIMKKESSLTALAHQSSVNRVIDYIENNISSKIELDDLAQAANLSKYHFLRVFKALTGETPLQFLVRLRLEKIATSLLLKPDESIGSIANDFGFFDISSFSKNFRIQFGFSATEWRLKNSNNSQLNSNNSPLVNKSLEYFYKQTNSKKLELKEIENKSINVLNLEPFQVAYSRHQGSYISDDSVHERMWGKMFAWASSKGYLSKPNIKTLVVYHDNPNLTPAEKQRMSFCISISEDVKVDNKVGKMIIDGGKYLVVSFSLKANEFSLAWHNVMNWLPESGYVPDSRYCFEMCSEEPKNGLFDIDIYIPIRM